MPRPSLRSRFSLVLFGLVLAALLAPTLAAARKKGKPAEDPEAPALTIPAWLRLGPIDHPLPLFHDEPRGGAKVADLLDLSLLGEAATRPTEGAEVGWIGDRALTWTRTGSGQALPTESREEGAAPAVVWVATYLTVDRWTVAELEVVGEHPREAWLDGKSVASGESGEVKGKLELTPGRHLLLIQTVRDPASEAAWRVGGKLTDPDGKVVPTVTLSLDPRRHVELADILDPPTYGSLALSPDGTRMVVNVARIVPGTFDRESWLEIRGTADGSLDRTWRGAQGARDVDWSPDGRYISYVAKAVGKNESGDASTLYLYDLETNRVLPLIESVEHLRGYLWSPDGRHLAYTVETEAEKDERGVVRLESLLDRQAGHRDRQHLYLAGVPDGVRRRITAGAFSTNPLEFSPDGRRLLFSRLLEDLTGRPYTRTELWELELESLTAKRLRDFSLLNAARYSPDGERLLIVSGAGEFGDAGSKLGPDRIVNSYDGQIFLWAPGTGAVDPVGREFRPAVRSARWSHADGRIYLTAEDRDAIRLFRFDPRTREFTTLDTGTEIFTGLVVASGAPVAAGLGTSTWDPQSLIAVDLATDEVRELSRPGESWFRDVTFGTVEEWSFEAEASGRTIDGRIYLPPGFDPGRRYPAIVYYYGGTSPTNRSFGGRYPKEWWASHGYVVYVPQPSGATGWGQDFAAAHVNDWGKTTSAEIIEGTRKFLGSHPFVDPARVGCIGASYGGFMTMLLTTETDLFAAAVSHAGISSISSYWGEGYWGYLYSSVATAESFPWNRPDVYVEQSPLFRADRNRVPILLTHGTADTNVPVGESDAFFIALRLLGKDVEYVRIEGQDHHILDRRKREVWSNSIVAWFDRWLKDQPEWWDSLYPDPDAEKSPE